MLKNMKLKTKLLTGFVVVARIHLHFGALAIVYDDHAKAFGRVRVGGVNVYGVGT